MSEELYADVVLELEPGERRPVLTYLVPPGLVEQIRLYQAVWVPLRDTVQLGVVARLHNERPPFTVRPLVGAVEPAYALTPVQWALAEWLAEETLCTLWEAVALFLPPRLTQRVEYVLRPTGIVPAGRISSVHRQLLELLARRGPLTLEQARRALGRSLAHVVERAIEAGTIERIPVVRPVQRVAYERFLRARPDPALLDETMRAAYEAIVRWQAEHEGALLPQAQLRRLGLSPAMVRELIRRGAVELVEFPRSALALASGEVDRPLTLTSEQQRAWEEIRAAFDCDPPQAVLLHGVTGSGKTELYLRAIGECLRRGRQAIVLVPEIALATQVVQRVAARFPGRTVLLHSGLREAERVASWEAIREGRADVVVGPRSALFAPLRDIGLIVVDEEHEAAYKQQEPAPRYHARAVAQRLAELSRAVLVLGSATPDVVTMYQAASNRLRLVRLRERVGPAVLGRQGQVERLRLALPRVEVVDMRLEHQLGNPGLFSRALLRAIAEALQSGEQVLLLMNRRGLATLVQCRSCGHVESCPLCDVPLVFHADRRQLICHRCDLRRLPSTTCPACGRPTLGYYGAGTQRIEREVRQHFPTARVLRWDQDVVRQGADPRRLLQAVLRREVDVIVGTQMVAKGFDFPAVTVVGIVHADSAIYLPDYRSAERAFQLLTQVAGRAGRHLPRGRVVIQSYTPEHYAIRAASRQDYETFYEEELAFRERHGYPPFRRLVRLLLRHRDEVAGRLAAEEVAERLRAEARRCAAQDIEVLGPTPAFVSRIRGFYQWQLLVRGADGPRVVAGVSLHGGWIVDVDPVSLL
uniref:Replication restart protein PriA n=1 Tax=Thermomicrobium roseum TaxID=500 RepID=A0A7C1JUW7_THERO